MKHVGIDVDSLIIVIKHCIKGHGTQKAFAKSIGISNQYLNDIIHKRREPGVKVCKALGFTRNTLYVFQGRPS